MISSLSRAALGALDLGRWHLAVVPAPPRAGAILGMTAAGLLIFYAMQSNCFSSSVVPSRTIGAIA